MRPSWRWRMLLLWCGAATMGAAQAQNADGTAAASSQPQDKRLLQAAQTAQTRPADAQKAQKAQAARPAAETRTPAARQDPTEPKAGASVTRPSEVKEDLILPADSTQPVELAPTAAGLPPPVVKAPSLAQPVLPKVGAASFVASLPPQATALADMPTHEMGQVIVAVPADTAAPSFQDLAVALGGVLRGQAQLEALGLRLAVLQFGSDTLARAAVQALAERLPQAVVDLHARSYTQQAAAAVPDPASLATDAKFYASTMVLGANHQPPACSARVGIIDTALRSDAAQQLLTLSGLKEQRFISPLDRAAAPEHGTAVAAIIAGRGLVSVAPGVALYQAAVMRTDKGHATSNTLSLLLALNWLGTQGVDVVNMSLASSGDRVLAYALQRYIDQGGIVVAAVGPGAAAPHLIYPAAYPGVIAVAAVDAARKPFALSARAAYVGISAPGVDLWLPVVAAPAADAPAAPAAPVSAGAYYSGSSFAAPWVSGVIAQLKAAGQLQGKGQVLPQLCAMAWSWQPAPVPGMGCGVLRWAL